VQISEHLKFSARGFSPKRIGYLLGLVCFGFLPVHFANSSCEQSEGLAAFVFGITLVVLVLCLFTPRSEPQRFRPFIFAFLVLVLHSLSTH
jgi:hypothetical protein